MKNVIFGALVVSSAFLVACGAKNAEPEAEQAVALDTIEQKVSHLIGYNAAAELSSQGLDIDEAAYIDGLRRSLAGEEAKYTPEEAQQIFTDFQAKLQQKAQAEFEAAASENAAKSEAFLAENASKEGVSVTESGLQYKVLEAGEGGEKPSATSTVQVHYEGKLIDGEVFDSSIARGAPVEFGLNQVIPGWTEGLQLMEEGSTYEFYIPSNLAYGPSGNRSIGPNQALVFQVELIQANFNPESEDSATETQ